MRKPNVFKLLPGLRWKGKLRVTGVEPAGVAVQFDAEAPLAPPTERYVCDCAVLTPQQFQDWTGTEPPAELEK